MLLANRPTRQLLSSRIILTRPSISGGARFVGLLAEQVTEASKIPDSEFTDTGLKGDESIFVDKLAVRPDGLVQHINVDLLLPQEVKEMLRGYSSENGAVAE
jgi:chemotaxis signal transduction protein